MKAERDGAVVGVPAVPRNRRLPADPVFRELAAAAARASRQSLRFQPQAFRAPRGAAALTRSGRILHAPELAAVAGVGGPAEVLVARQARLESAGAITHLLVRGGRTGLGDGGSPTAATLQVLLELAPGALIYWGTSRRPEGGERARAFLPGAFSASHLRGVSPNVRKRDASPPKSRHSRKRGMNGRP